MTQKTLATIRKYLLKKRNDLLYNIEQEEGEKTIIIKNKNADRDMVDEANNISEMQVYNRLEEMDRMKLQGIDQALERIKNGIYGNCLVCNGKIDEKRLLAIPEARMCVFCQTEREKKRASIGGGYVKTLPRLGPNQAKCSCVKA